MMMRTTRRMFGRVCVILTAFSLIFAVTAQDGVPSCEVRLQELRGIVDEKEKVFAADIIGLQQELETAGTDLGLCQAKSMAADTREAMLKDQITQLEEQSGTAHDVIDLRRTVRELQAELEAAKQAAALKAKEFAQEREAMQQAVEKLEIKLETVQGQAGDEFKHVDSLRVELEDTKKKHAAELEAMKAQISPLQEKLDRSESEKSNLQKAASDTKAELTKAQNAVEKSNNDRKVSEKEFQSKIEELNKVVQTLQEQLNAKEADSIEIVQRQVDEAVQQATEKADKRIRMLEIQKDGAFKATKTITQDANSAKEQLQETKNELFTVRRELFELNEKLREPELRRRLMMKRLQEFWDNAKELVKEGIDSVRPYYEAYVIPVLIKIQPYWNSCVAFVCEQVKTHAPVVKEKASMIYEVTSTQASIQARSLQAVAKNHTDKVMNAVKPHSDKLMRDTEEPRLRLKAHYDKLLKPSVQKFLQLHAEAKESSANALSSATGLLLDYFKVQKYSPTVIQMTEEVHDKSAQIVHYAEWCVAILCFVWIRRCRRRRGKQAVAPSQKVKLD